jgi:hypothetical protein
MINQHQPRWYHNLMLPFGAQCAIMFCAGLVTLVQFGFYEGIEQDIVVFDGECEYQTALNSDDEPTDQLTAQCGEHNINLTSDQERLIHYHELTTGNRAVYLLCED